MIDLSVMPVHIFTKWHKRQPRIPDCADWNAIPIEEIIHNYRQTFFYFFQSHWGKGKKCAPPFKTNRLGKGNYPPKFAVTTCAVEKAGCDHKRDFAAATHLAARSRHHNVMGTRFTGFVWGKGAGCEAVLVGKTAMTQPMGQLCHGGKGVSIRRRAA